MSNSWLERFGGFALIVGGLMATAAHMLDYQAPVDPAQLGHYARISQPVHLVLLSGGIVVLLGCVAHVGLQSDETRITGLLAFVLLFLGILLADLLHCVLEISIFPVLIASVPYATLALAEQTYRSTPMATLQNVGLLCLLLGVPLTGMCVLRCGVLPRWAASPFAITSGLMVMSIFESSSVMRKVSAIAMYLSMVVLGAAIHRASGPVKTDAGPPLA